MGKEIIINAKRNNDTMTAGLKHDSTFGYKTINKGNGSVAKKFNTYAEARESATENHKYVEMAVNMPTDKKED